MPDSTDRPPAQPGDRNRLRRRIPPQAFLPLIFVSSISLPWLASCAAATCSGVVNGSCSAECQVQVCSALRQFYDSTSRRSWYQDYGWEATRRQGCAEIMQQAAAGQQQSAPPYCDWFGVQCCNDTSSCAARGTVQALVLQASKLCVGDGVWCCCVHFH
jgi:hypothetical protein